MLLALLEKRSRAFSEGRLDRREALRLRSLLSVGGHHVAPSEHKVVRALLGPGAVGALLFGIGFWHGMIPPCSVTLR